MPNPLRVGVVGAESTGKTTLCARLAKHYGGDFVEEYGRTYTEARCGRGETGDWVAHEFEHIAKEQARLEELAAIGASDVLICDTDVLTTAIWHEHYLGEPAPQWEMPNRIDLYLLAGLDVPFEQDDIRAGEHSRERMHARLLEELVKTGIPIVELRGSIAERERAAITAIDGARGALKNG